MNRTNLKPDEILAAEIQRLNAEGNRKKAEEIWKELYKRKFGEIVKLFSKVIEKWRVQEVIKPEDLAEKIFKVFFGKIQNYNQEIKFNTWIEEEFKTHKFKVLEKELKKRFRIIPFACLPFDPDPPNPDSETIEDSLIEKTLYNEMKKYFDDKGRSKNFTVLVLKIKFGMNYREIAEFMGYINENSSKKEIQNESKKVWNWFQTALRVAEKFREENKEKFPEKYL